MAKKQVVLAYFADEAAADAAVESLKAWDEIDNQVKLNAIGVLVLDENGKVKAQKLGRRTVGKGAGIGLLLGLITPLGWGVVIGGAAAGALHHKGLGLKAATASGSGPSWPVARQRSACSSKTSRPPRSRRSLAILAAPLRPSR